MRRAFAIGLHHDAEPVPPGKAVIAQHRLDDVEREIQPVGLLGVDIEAHPGGFRIARQFQHTRNKLLHDAGGFGLLVARMQGRELDRDAGVVADIARAAFARQLGDGVLVGGHETGGVMRRHCRLAQHVIAVGEALPHLGLAALDRVADGFAQDELLPHLAHGPPHGDADHRLAQAFHRAAQGGADAGLFVFTQNLAGQHQRPGRGVDQAGGRLAQVAAPFRRRDLVLDQRIHRVGIRHAQERLGQAHQRHAFLGREAVFGEEHLHQAGLGIVADGMDQPGGIGADRGADLGVGRMRVGEGFDQPRLVGGMGGADLLAELVERGHGRATSGAELRVMAQDSIVQSGRLPLVRPLTGNLP